MAYMLPPIASNPTISVKLPVLSTLKGAAVPPVDATASFTLVKYILLYIERQVVGKDVEVLRLVVSESSLDQSGLGRKKNQVMLAFFQRCVESPLEHNVWEVAESGGSETIFLSR